jgi:hypothetical protein
MAGFGFKKQSSLVARLCDKSLFAWLIMRIDKFSATAC